MTVQSDSTLICFAVPSESQALRIARPDLKILHTGMGHENAAQAVEHYLETNDRPGMIISAGFAGGLNPRIKTGEVLIDATHAPPLSPYVDSNREAIGSFLCLKRIADTAVEKEQIWRNTKKDAVEMESGVILKIADEHHIPFATIRVISDAADEDLPINFNHLMTSDMRIHFPKLLWTLARKPSTIPKLIRFNKSIQRSAKNLAQCLSDALPKHS